MDIPNKIPIERIEEYHTHYLGKFDKGNQFWGYVTFNWIKPPYEIIGNWEDYRNEYAILHTFDKEGNYINTNLWLGGTTSQVSDKLLFSKLEEMVNKLGEIEFHDIEVKLFQTKIDGVIFGLIPNDDFGFVELQPNSTIAFGPPWDGSYST